MKMDEAKRIIEDNPKGYRVHFEKVGWGTLTSDYFPECGEALIETETEAWELARAFAAKTTGKCVNIYVIEDQFKPVCGYRASMIINR